MSSAIIAGAIIGGAMGFGSGLYGVSKGNRQLIKTFKKQMYYAQLNYNYNQAQLTKQQTSMYHNAMAQLGQLSYNAYLNNATVQAAQAQTGYQGRTSQAISRAISGQTLRQKTAIKDSYQNAVANVRSQKDALYIEMKNNVKQARQNLSNSFTHGINAFMQVLDSTAKGAAVGAFTGGVASAASGAVGGASAGAASAGASGATGAVGATGAAGVDAVSGAAVSATSTTASAGGVGALEVAGGAQLVSLGASSMSSTPASSTGFWNSFMSNYNTMYTQHQSMFNMFDNFASFTSQYNRRGGNYY